MLAHPRSSIPIGMAAIAGLLLAAGPARAQGQAEKLQVTAVIGDACRVTSAALDFGSDYDGSGPVPGSGRININCVVETPVGVELDLGLHPSAGGRFMAGSGGGTPLQYNLYTDTPGGSPWNVGVEVEKTIEGDDFVPVYGVIPQQTNGHAPGLHTDEVTVTLNF